MIRVVCSVYLIILLVGCSQGIRPHRFQAEIPDIDGEPGLQNTWAGPSTMLRSRLVASNLVASMQRVPEFSPKRPKISIPWPETEYARVLATTLQQAGFKLHLGKTPDALRLLTHSITPVSPVGLSRRYRFSLHLEGLDLSRVYQVLDSQLIPVTAMEVLGKASGIEQIPTDDSLFYPLR